MADRSLYDLFRKRIAPVAFLGGLVLLGVHTCSTEINDVEFQFTFGAAHDRVRSLRVDVFRHGLDNSVAVFERIYDGPGASIDRPIKAQLDSGSYTLFFHVKLDGETRRFERAVEVGDHAVITVPLERDLRPRR